MMDIVAKVKKVFGKLGRINKRIAEDAEDYILPDNPAEILAAYENYADALADDNPLKHNLQAFVRMAKGHLDEGSEDALKVSLLKIERCREAIDHNKLVSKVREPSQYGSTGGKRAAEVRAGTRKALKEKIKEEIRVRKWWDDWTQTQKSITDNIWSEINQAIQDGSDWHGIANTNLQRAKIGRQSVYDAVKETDPR